MAVLRNSQGQQAPQGRLPQVQQSQASAAQPDVNKHAAGHTAYENIVGPSTITMNNVRAQVPAKMMLVDALFGAGQQFANAKHEAQMEAAYMSGIAQFSSGVAEAELQASPWTRDWVTAGFRDTAGKMRLAEAEAKTLQLVKEMREQSPTEFAQVLEQRRASLLPQFEGMSRSQRGAVFAQLVTSDQAAIQKHAMAHGEFIIDTKRQGVHTLLATQAEMMQAEKGKPTYGAAVDSFITSLLANSIMDDTLPRETQQAYLAEGIAHAIATGNTQVYEMLAKQPIQFPDGTEGTVLSRLPLPANDALGQKYRQAVGNVVTQGSLDLLNQIGMAEVLVDDPYAEEVPSIEQYRDMVYNAIGQGIMPASSARTAVAAYAKKANQHAQRATAGQAWAAGDLEKVRRAGFSDPDREGAKMFDMSLRRQGLKPKERLTTMLRTANHRNSTAGFALVGEEIGPIFRLMGLPGENGPSKEDVEVMQAVLGVVDELTANGNSIGLASMYSGMSEEDVRYTQTAMANLRAFNNPQDAVRKTRDDITQANAASDVDRALANSGIQEFLPELEEMLDPFAWWRGISFTEAGHAQDMLAPEATKGSWIPFRNDRATLNEETQRLKTVVGTYLVEEVQRNPYKANTPEGAKELYVAAMAAAARNTVKHGDGAMYLKKHQSIESLFGTAPAISANGHSAISRALDDYAVVNIKGDLKDTTVLWRPSDNGQGLLTWTHYDANGVPLGTGDVPAKGIGEIATNKFDEDAKTADQLVGSGKTVTSRHGGVVTFNGASNTAVEPAMMFKLRENLVNHEGVKTTAYKDGVDKKTGKARIAVGVGINETSGLHTLKEGDVVDKEFVDRTFKIASERAASQAYDLMAASGVRGESTFLLLAEMAYQSGTISEQQPVLDMIAAIREGDPAKAMRLFQNTRAYQYSGAARQQHYSNLARKAAQGR